MKPVFVSDLKPDQVINTAFLVQHKEIRQKKGGEPYLSLLLADRTGQIDAKMWDNAAEVMDTFDRDDFLSVKGLIQIHHNRLQLTVHRLRRLEIDAVDLADFMPASRRDPAEMWSELRGMIAEISNPHIKALIEAVLDDADIAERFRKAPAAKSIHHAYLGGLLEHVLSLCRMARFAAPQYNVDGDLVLAGAVLHDLGKVYELTWDRTFGYSTEGQLLGHMAIAMRIVADKLRGLPDFPPKLRLLIEHMIVSHHGQVEFGSARVPQFLEALLLHHLDAMDAKMECMRAVAAQDQRVDGLFTGYITPLDRSVLKMDRYLGEDDGSPAAVAPVDAATREIPPVAEGRGAMPARTSVFGNKLLAALSGNDKAEK